MDKWLSRFLREPDPRPVRVCSSCKRTYPADLTFFYKHSTNKSGLSSWCRACFKMRYAQKKPVVHRTVVDMTEPKLCPSCMEKKPRTVEFWYKNERMADGLSGWCRPCYKLGRQRKSYQQFVEKMRTTGGYHSDFTFDVYRRMKGWS
jgi:hypothetical protein